MITERFVAKYQPHKADPTKGPWIVGDRLTRAVYQRCESQGEAESEAREANETLRAVREAWLATS